MLEAALAVPDREVVETAARLLAPYPNRAVVNAGAVMFHGVTDDTLARAAALLGDPATAAPLRARALATYESIGARWWRERLASWTPPLGGGAAPAGPGRVHLHPAPGGLWLVGREPDAAPMQGLRGFGYVRELLRRPNQPVPALDLAGARTGVMVASAGLGEIIDKRALTAYRNRLRDIDQEIAEARDWSDAGRLAALRSERDALLDEIARATGLGGRARTAGSSRERARIAVRKAITAAIDRIATVDDVLAGHLRATITTGLTCSYEPDAAETVDWVLD